MGLQQHINSRNAFILSAILLGTGLGCSNLFMSLGQFGLVLAFLWDGNFKAKIKNLKEHPNILVFTGIYGLFLLGLITTQNFPSAFHDLKIKLPLLIIPFFFATFAPFTTREWKIIFHSLFIGCMISMLFGGLMMLGIVDWQVKDMRSYSPFVSHLRLATLLVFCIFLSIYFFVRSEYRMVPVFVYAIFIVAAFVFILILQSITGMIAFLVCVLGICIYGLFKKRYRILMLFSLLGFVAVASLIVWMFAIEYKRIHHWDPVSFSGLPRSTPYGSIYRHDTLSTEKINGHYVNLYIAHNEMRNAWEKRSKLGYDSTDRKGYYIHHTLIRYLTSRGLRKDANGINALSDKEIKAIENGTTNFLAVHPLDLRYRINQVLVEMDIYQRSGEANDMSFATRLETWRVARYAIRYSPWIGSGTGDVNDVMKKAYAETNSSLTKEHHLNPHQQFLTTALALGIPLTALISIALFFPLVRLDRLNILFLLALIINFVSMLDEDVWETQAGCTQFVFLYLLTRIFQKGSTPKIPSG